MQIHLIQCITAEERFIIHDLFMESKQGFNKHHVPMHKTHNESLILCQPSVNMTINL